MPEVIVINTEDGKLLASEVRNVNEISVAVKDAAANALKRWSPDQSDFTIIRSYFEARYKLPLDPALYDKIMELGLELYREGDEVIVKVPVYTISYNNQWLGDTYHDKGVIVVSLYIDDEEKRQLEEYAIGITREPKRISQETYDLELSEEDLRRLEEGLEEAVEEPKKKRKRKR
ncbi:MAG: DUF2286 domain-containing protein [Pyrodictiaceae archaeon]